MRSKEGCHSVKLSAAPARCLLDSLVAVQDASEQLCHEGFEVGVRRLADHPVCIAAESPAGDGADQRLFVAQAQDEVRDELGQVGDHTLHAA